MEFETLIKKYTTLGYVSKHLDDEFDAKFHTVKQMYKALEIKIHYEK